MKRPRSPTIEEALIRACAQAEAQIAALTGAVRARDEELARWRARDTLVLYVHLVPCAVAPVRRTAAPGVSALLDADPTTGRLVGIELHGLPWAHADGPCALEAKLVTARGDHAR